MIVLIFFILPVFLSYTYTVQKKSYLKERHKNHYSIMNSIIFIFGGHFFDLAVVRLFLHLPAFFCFTIHGFDYVTIDRGGNDFFHGISVTSNNAIVLI